MTQIARIDQLKNAGIIDPKQLSPKARALIESLTDDEFHAILTARAKISDDADRKSYDQQIQVMGF
jgi:hypothetical protein